MARTYSEKFLRELNGNHSDSYGIKLAKLCVEANLPASAAALALEVSSTTVYEWFRGQGVREANRKNVEIFMKLVEQDLENGRLPATSLIDAKRYVSNLMGVSV